VSDVKINGNEYKNKPADAKKPDRAK